MNQSELRDLLQRYQEGTCTPQEQRVVEDWYDVLGHERELAIGKEEKEVIQAALWERIAHDTFEAQDISPPASVWRAPIRWAAAAALAAAIGLGAHLVLSPDHTGTEIAATNGPALDPDAPQWMVYVNHTAKPYRLALPDSSQVLVSPESELKYPSQFRTERRVVHLKGEAFFEVTHDARRPFLVYTNKIVTTVLGTSFVVQAPVGQQPVVVQVRTGKVRVTPRAETEATEAQVPGSIVVLPNQQAVYMPAQHQLQRKLVAQPALLAPQPFVFDDRPVAEVLAALEVAYGVHIVYDAPKLAGCTVNLALRNETLYGKLDVLCKMLNASYEQKDAQIIFHSNGC